MECSVDHAGPWLLPQYPLQMTTTLPGRSAGISHYAFRLGERTESLEDLHGSGRLTSPPEVLRDFGFQRCYVHDGPDATELMLGAARELLAGEPVEPGAISALFVYSGLPPGPPPDGGDPMAPFRYDLGRLRHELELDRVPAYRLSQLGCCGLMSTLRLAGGTLDAEGSTALVLTGECFGPRAHREILYNVMSDAASALLVERSSRRNRTLAEAEVVQSYYWDSPARADEILASYFPLAERTVARVLEKAGIGIDEVRWIVPHNVSRRSWEILCDMIGADPERVWMRNIAAVGHTVSCDHVINLSDMESEGVLDEGDRLLLFTFGFGAAWSATVIER